MVPDSFIVGALQGEPCSFADMRLHVGMRLQVLRVRDLSRTKYTTTLIGWEEGAYMIVKTPLAGGLSVPLGEAEALVLRAFSGVNVHSFGTRLVHNFREPLHYLHIEFPTEIRALAFRSAPRVRVQIPARIDRGGGEAAGEVVITDLSVAGAQARATQPVANPGDTVDVRFDLASPVGGSHSLTLKARVRNRREGVEAGTMMFGLQFETPDEDAHLRLQNHVYERMLESRAHLA